MEPTQVVPPYLHIMLGVVKKHQTLLQQDCHSLDQDIGMALAKEIDTNYEDSSPFGQYVNELQSIEKDKIQKQFHEAETVFLERENCSSDQDFQEKQMKLRDQLDVLCDSIERETKELQKLPLLSGPVTASLDDTLKKNNLI